MVIASSPAHGTATNQKPRPKMITMKAAIILLALIYKTHGNEETDRNGGIICEIEPSLADSAEFFYYFAYGSNLLPTRMHMNVPSARNCSAAKLDGWRLDFNNLTALHRWNGGVATIVQDKGFTVMGNIWRISMNDSDKLDHQEGVPNNWYKRVEMKYVMLRNNATVSGRTYIMVDVPAKVEPEKIPQLTQPSRTYLQVILFGAIACRIPVSHIEYIQRFPHNGKIAPTSTRKSLGYPFYDETVLK